MDDLIIPLTEREKEVLRLVVRGRTSKMIGKELHLSKKTIDSHRRNLLLKTRTSNLAELIAWAIKHDIV